MAHTQKHPLTPEGQFLFDTFNARIDSLKKELLSNQVPEKDHYRAMEVCRILGISRSKFEQLKRDGLFPTHKVGGMIYVAATDIEKYLPKAKK